MNKKTECHLITFATTKGGAGKSTTALLLALGLLDAGWQVLLAEFEQGGPFNRLYGAAYGNRPLPGLFYEDLSQVSIERGQERLFELREGAGNLVLKRSKGLIILVDTEGVRTNAWDALLANSDLVVVPVRPDAMSKTRAVEMYHMLYSRSKAELLRFVFVGTRSTGAVLWRADRALFEEAEEDGWQVLGGLPAYASMQNAFELGCLPKPGTTARRAIEHMVEQTLATLRESTRKGKAA